VVEELAREGVWCIHNSSPTADTLFLGSNIVAVGWPELGNLGTVAQSKESLRQLVSATYPERSKASVAGATGQLYRFIAQMREGELVVYRSKQNGAVHLGLVRGNYSYAPEISPEYPHTRQIEWIRESRASEFSPAALREIRAALTFFGVQNNGHEFKAIAKGEAVPVKKPKLSLEAREMILRKALGRTA